jgi:hypothetical protein
MSTEPPDLSSYGEGMGPEYEWLISDHPWAVAERNRRAAGYFAAEQPDEPAASATWDPALDEDDPAGMRANLGEEIGGLVEPVETLPDPNQTAHTSGDVEPDEVAVLRLRTEYEAYRRENGEPEYAYPASYTGARAAEHAPPGVPVG